MHTSSRDSMNIGPRSRVSAVPTGRLQRTCACGQHTIAGGECEACRQRRERGAAWPNVIPPLVHEVLRSPGQPLDAPTRAFMEPRFGHDFSHVRVHTDARAAESARMVNAHAYTVGSDIAFAPGQYAPATAAGRRLLAHELTHVTQQQASGNRQHLHRQLTVGLPDTVHEREAAHYAEKVMRGERTTLAASTVAPATIQRTLTGGLIGGLLGAAGGAALGALVGGPIGAVIGGVVGLIGGALIGNTASTCGRKLNGSEIALAREVFQTSIDYSLIEITRDSMFAAGAPRTIGNTIHLKSDWGHFQGDTLDLTDQGRQTLIHEMTHVWQYQNGGLAYIPQSLIAQLRAALSGGSRNAAYNWRAAHDAHIPWERWNPEQQAEAVEEYNVLLQRTHAGTATVEDYNTISILLPYIRHVQRREGAPTFGLTGDDQGLLTRGPGSQ